MTRVNARNALTPRTATYHNARNSAGDGALKSAESVRSNLVGSGLLGAVLTGADHRGLEQSALQQDVVVVQGLVHCGQDAFGVVSADLSSVTRVKFWSAPLSRAWSTYLNGVITVHKNFGFDNRDQTIFLMKFKLKSITISNNRAHCKSSIKLIV